MNKMEIKIGYSVVYLHDKIKDICKFEWLNFFSSINWNMSF